MTRLLSPIAARPWLATLLVFLGIFLAAEAWAVSTPLSGSPDESSHIVKAAAVVRGEFIGKPTSEPAITNVVVPGDIATAPSWPCFMFRADVTADCHGPFTGGPDRTTWTSAGLYDPLYYLAVGWPSLLFSTAHATVFAMRTIGALLCSAFLAIAFAALRRSGLRFFAGATIFAAATPMVLFLSASVNPNGLEVASGVALLALLLALVRGDGTGRRWMLPLAFLSGAVLVNMRGISPVWLAVIGIAAIVGARKGRLGELLRLPGVWITLVGIAIAGAFAVAWILGTNTLNSMGTFSGAGYTPPISAFVTMVLNRSIDPAFVGIFGWLDTFPPSYVTAVWGALAGGMAVLALIVARRRLVYAFIVTLAGLVLVPAVTQAGSVVHSGYIWQGRYSLVAFACVVLVAGVVLGERFDLAVLRSGFARRAVWTLSVLVLTAHLLALVFAIKRYSRGASTEWLSFIAHPGWQPPGGWVVWPVVMTIGIALVAVAWRASTLAAPALGEPAAHLEGPSANENAAATTPLAAETTPVEERDAVR
ncbi:DUF2142 domain-containing protein [Leifsonia sp. AG29]|uniref:DUF2142 domain-containing protein n=1 Tax=Leifsonia sp. AG29 TaxID=2598860 RepID=UPI00131BC979|nr:DUF2142 domain-containing protein [Leifsonia sp. AG29]